MAYAEGQTDLSLRLYDGSIHQYRPGGAGRIPADLLQDQRDPGQERLRRAGAEHQRIHPGRPGDEHLRDAGRHPRGRHRGERVGPRPPRISWSATSASLLDLPPPPEPDNAAATAPPPVYCGWIQSVQDLVLPRTAEAQAPAQGQGKGQATRARDSARAAAARVERHPADRARRPARRPRDPGRPAPRSPGVQDSGNRRLVTGRSRRPRWTGGATPSGARPDTRWKSTRNGRSAWPAFPS